jgi:hypothetical protein
MQPEFSIKHLKTEQITQVLALINKYTQGRIDEFISEAFDYQDLDSYIAALDATNYFCFKTIIYQQLHIDTLKRQLNKNDN